MEENRELKDIKNFLEELTGTELGLKKAKQNEEDFQRETFEQIILAIEKINNRSLLMETDFKVHFYEYDSGFHEIIEALLILKFGYIASELIFTYLYERVNPDGSINDIMGENGERLSLNNPTELWLAIKQIENKKKRKK